jgi:hypothetical protein
MRYTGVWIDYNGADIIHITDDLIESVSIESNIDHYNPRGGSKSKLAWGPVETISEKKYQARRQQQCKNFFNAISLHLKASNSVVIMGPAEAKIKFNSYLKDTKGVDVNVHKVLTVDSMTQNQKVAKVKEIYSVL